MSAIHVHTRKGARTPIIDQIESKRIKHVMLFDKEPQYVYLGKKEQERLLRELSPRNCSIGHITREDDVNDENLYLNGMTVYLIMSARHLAVS